MLDYGKVIVVIGSGLIFLAVGLGVVIGYFI